MILLGFGGMIRVIWKLTQLTPNVGECTFPTPNSCIDMHTPINCVEHLCIKLCILVVKFQPFYCPHSLVVSPAASRLHLICVLIFLLGFDVLGLKENKQGI